MELKVFSATIIKNGFKVRILHEKVSPKNVSTDVFLQ